MSIIGSNIIAGASGQATGYNLNNSLRFRASASAYLSRTFTTPTDGKKWTWSGWVKRGILTNGTGTVQQLFSAGSAIAFFRISQTDTLLSGWTGASNLETTQVFRDPSAWYHIMLVVDTTQATAANRVKYYVNSVQITAFATTDYPTQNSTTTINSAVAHNIAAYTSSTQYFDGYMTEVNFIDGQALTPSSFGETDTTTGSWIPKAYTSTYGTNGFYLKGRGTDNSGNGNNWTENNFNTSNSALTTYDIMLDVPTLTSATVANYCVNNPVDTSPAGGVNAITISAANLNLAGASSDWAACRATIGVTSGKWYWECTRTGASNLIFGIGLNSTTLVNAYSSTSYGYFSTGDKYSNNVSSAYGASFTSGDVIGVAFDADAGTLTFYKNNTSQGTAYTGLTSGPYFPLNQLYTTGSTASINFGQRPFAYTPPSGFVALNTYNLPDSTIKKGNTVMDATLYTGTGSAQSITNAASFKPDLVWLKSRSAATDNKLTDSVRGTTKALVSNSAAAETTDVTGMTAFNANGFTVGASTTYNNTGATYVGWQWQAGQGSTSSNTSGSITSTVSVNATAGFSVITYTGNGTSGATIGHGLGVAPKWIIIKDRIDGGNEPTVYHASIGNTGALLLNTTIATSTSSTFWNNTSPTSTTFTLGNGPRANTNTNTYVAYCWAEIAGFSKFGSYTGNGSTDGPFVYTGFRPRYLLVKRTDSAGYDWFVWDSMRDPTNACVKDIYPNITNAEETNNRGPDLLSNGFKMRATATYFNASGGTYIYMAFAENPFKNSNAR